MTRRLATALAALTLLAPALSACESTQDKASKLAASSKDAFAAKGLQVAKENPDIEIVDATPVQDPNGTAVAVTLRNTTDKALVGVPVSVDVQDAKGESLYKNDAAGLDTSLVQIALVRPKETVTWVNDQVTASATPSKATALAGAQERVLSGEVPRITLQQVKVTNDVDGPKATGFIVNKSQVDQRELVIYGVVKRGGKVVAAGRGQVPRVKPGKRVEFNVFFIGDPTKGTLDLAVPATVTR